MIDIESIRREAMTPGPLVVAPLQAAKIKATGQALDRLFPFLSAPAQGEAIVYAGILSDMSMGNLPVDEEIMAEIQGFVLAKGEEE